MPVSAKSHRKTVSRPGSVVSVSSSRTPSLFMEGALPVTSRTTSFSSTTSLSTPVDFGVLEFHGRARKDSGTLPNGKLKRMMSSMSPFKSKQAGGEADRELAPGLAPQVKEMGKMRRKWKNIVASMRR